MTCDLNDILEIYMEFIKFITIINEVLIRNVDLLKLTIDHKQLTVIIKHL